MKTISVKIYRYDMACPKPAYYDTYHIPLQEGMSAMNVLDYIYEHLDSSVAYYNHAACALGICGKCLASINGQLKLLCQTVVTDDIVLEPANVQCVLKDLVTSRFTKQ